jgi:hypothetical protein
MIPRVNVPTIHIEIRAGGTKHKTLVKKRRSDTSDKKNTMVK